MQRHLSVGGSVLCRPIGFLGGVSRADLGGVEAYFPTKYALSLSMFYILESM